MSKLKIISILLIVSLPFRETYRFVGFFPLPGRSQMVMFETLMKALAENSHEVDVLSHFPQEKPTPGYTDISVRGSVPIFVNNFSIAFIQESMGSYSQNLEYIVFSSGTELCRKVLDLPPVRELKNAKDKYDLIISSIFTTDCFLGFAHLFKIPTIGMISSAAVPWSNDRIGNPDNPSYIPNYFMHSSSRMDFIQRLTNTLTLLGAKLGYEIISDMVTDKITREFFGPDLPDINDLVYNTSLILVNSHFSIFTSRPTVPNFIEVGGLHIKPPEPLSKYLEDVLDIGSQYKGVIYLSMGTMALSETFCLDKLQAFFNVFKDLPYLILWKANGQQMPKDLNVPANIHFEQWLPQKDILCHPNVKLFISHGGLMGSQEAVYCGVPRLGIPLFSDQELNLKIAESLDLAIMLSYVDLTEDKIRDALKLLLSDTDNRYKETAKRVSKIFKDRPLSAIDTAIYWVEYVLRHNGAFHLKSVGADLSWFQYYMLDVGITLLAVPILFTVAIYYLLYRIIKKIVCVCKGKQKGKAKIIKTCK